MVLNGQKISNPGDWKGKHPNLYNRKANISRMVDLKTIAEHAPGGPMVTLATPEVSEVPSIDFEGPINIFYADECSIKSIVIQTNNAVVCRTARPQLHKGHTSLLVFKHLPPTVDPSSFRIKVKDSNDHLDFFDQHPNGINHCLSPDPTETDEPEPEDSNPSGTETSRTAYIQDVRFHIVHINEDEAKLDERRKLLMHELKRINHRLQFLTNRYQRLSKQQGVLENFADNLLSKVSTGIIDSEDMLEEQLDEVPRINDKSRTRSQSRMRNTAKDGVKQTIDIPTETVQLSQIETMRHFFTLYNTQSQQLDEDAIKVGEEIEQSRLQIRDIESQLVEVDCCRNQLISKELHILLEARTENIPELEISYSVDHVSWTPAYDIRLTSSTATMQLMYYGFVTQSTGEDWESGKLTLSTAVQTQINSLPELNLEKLSFKQSNNSSTEVIRTRNLSIIDKAKRKLKARSFHADDSMEISFHQHPEFLGDNLQSNDQIEQQQDKMPSNILRRGRKTNKDHEIRFSKRSTSLQKQISFRQAADGLPLSNNRGPELFRCPSSSLDNVAFMFDGSKELFTHKYLTTYVPKLDLLGPNFDANGNQYFPSLSFDVIRSPNCIRGNGEPQRVTLATIEFKPSLQYVTIPKQVPKAFLRVRMHNTSDFALLDGPTSIYIDNNYIGKTRIPATAVQEEFVCDLGVDPGIQITYKPRHKYKKSGHILGSKTMSIVFKQIITISNIYPRSIRILVIDQLPVSLEEKLKVQLIEPAIKNPDKYDPTKPIRITKSKMVEWDLELEPYESRELVLKYLVEHPSLKDIDISSLEMR